MNLSVFELNSSAYLTAADQYERKFRNLICDFLKDPTRRCLLIEAADTRLVSLNVVRILKTIYDEPPNDIYLHRFLGLENQFYSEWRALLEATSSSPDLQKLRNLLVCEVTKVECADHQEVAFFVKAIHMFMSDVVKKMIFVSSENAALRSFTSGIGEIPIVCNDFLEWAPAFDRTSLYRAALTGSIDVVKLNLDNNVKIDELGGPDGGTALHAASRNGHLNVVTFLMRHYANVNIQDRNGDTPLCLAIKNRRYNVVEALLENGAGIHANMTPLMQQDLLDVVKVLVNSGDATPDRNDFSLLYAAVKSENAQLLSWLLDSGIDKFSLDTYERSAMHVAAENGSLDICKLLNKAGLSVTSRAKFWGTVLDCAMSSENLDLIIWLLHHKALVSSRDMDGRACAAALEGNLIVLETLVKYIDDINSKGPNGYALLHYAVLGRNLDAVSWLSNQTNIDINVKSDKGETPTSIAFRGQPDVAEFLIKKGGEFCSVDYWAHYLIVRRCTVTKSRKCYRC